MRGGIDSGRYGGGYSQADERDYARFTDQHGRLWGAVIEKKTGHPCGPPLHPFQWTAPLEVPGKYIAITDTPGRRIEVLYDAWIQDLRRAKKDWDDFVMSQAIRMYGNKGPEAIKNADPTLMAIAGRPPMSDLGVQAAKAGNKWVLGLTAARPKGEWVDLAFPLPIEVPEPDFSDAEEFAEPATVGAKRRPGRPPKAKPEEVHESWKED